MNEEGHIEKGVAMQPATTPAEEIAALQARIAELEKNKQEAPMSHEAPTAPEAIREEAIAQSVNEYMKAEPEAVLDPDFQMKVDAIEEQILNMSPEHDAKMDELAQVIVEKGIKNAIRVAQGLNDPHIEDDFHRFLIQYLAEGLAAPGLKEGTPMFRALNMVLFEITLPEENGGDANTFASLVSAMEQFYQGMLSTKDTRDMKRYFTLELALSHFSDEVVFYAGVPKSKVDLFQKQLHGAFPRAQVTEHKEDYNPFNQTGGSAASVATLAKEDIFPLKTYAELEQDSLNTMLNVFSKLDRDDEGAALQIVVAPGGSDLNDRYHESIERYKKGETLERALEGTAKRMTREFAGGLKDAIFGEKKKVGSEIEMDQEKVGLMEEKIASPILRTNVRLVASAASAQRAKDIVGELESAFNQFAKQQSNEFRFTQITGEPLRQTLHEFTFRLFDTKHIVPLNLKELTTVFHFPVGATNSSQLKTADLVSVAAPLDAPQEGIHIGTNEYRGVTTEIHMSPEDRLRHMYVVGQTGTGKTHILKNMVIQDILNGDGVCFMDPHGTDLEDILNSIPYERQEDVIYFDPSDMERPMGLNMLEYDVNVPEQKTFVVNEMLAIFNKLFDMKVAGGPMFEQYFRNATMLVIEDPDTGSTLLDVARVLADDMYRELKIRRCKNPLVVQFWRDIASKAGGESSLQNMVPYITNKFDVFLSNDIMRLMMAQQKSAFNFRDVMDNKKILLVNLAKGKLGEINSHLIGLILVGKILMAALSRVDSVGKDLPPFYLYIDEFQNVTTDSISAILSEARKYKLSLNVAHQFIAQLDPDIRDAIFGNVGSMAVFRVGAEDAQFLESQFAPVFSAADIMKIPNRNAYVKPLFNGVPQKPFNMVTNANPEPNPERGAEIKAHSQAKYGRDRAEIEEVLKKKYEKRPRKRPGTQGTANPKASGASSPNAPVQLSVNKPSTMQDPVQKPTIPPVTPPADTQEEPLPQSPPAESATTPVSGPETSGAGFAPKGFAHRLKEKQTTAPMVDVPTYGVEPAPAQEESAPAPTPEPVVAPAPSIATPIAEVSRQAPQAAQTAPEEASTDWQDGPVVEKKEESVTPTPAPTPERTIPAAANQAIQPAVTDVKIAGDPGALSSVALQKTPGDAPPEGAAPIGQVTPQMSGAVPETPLGKEELPFAHDRTDGGFPALKKDVVEGISQDPYREPIN